MSDNFLLTALRAFNDNYIWAVTKDTNTMIVDPGQAAPILEFLAQNKNLKSILITHKHQDHIAGLDEVLKAYPNTPVFWPKGEGKHAGIQVTGGDSITKDTSHMFDLTVFDTPGHTKGHISYLAKNFLFCGDTLFSCGCGRLFEGDEHDLAKCMTVFKTMPADTLVCCGHEYTLSNIAFAKAVDPDNVNLQQWETKAKNLLSKGQPTLPTILGDEFKYNPFLRADDETIIESASNFAGEKLTSQSQVLKVLRSWKDNF